MSQGKSMLTLEETLSTHTPGITAVICYDSTSQSVSVQGHESYNHSSCVCFVYNSNTKRITAADF